ncbi:hypothetical protein BRD13_01270 [Halobacteriales archaeon SW_5_70_135]|nr:MAG: hypothetical protein BRD13_01270 [Halobacteriales archaeon SW_5_70_135]
MARLGVDLVVASRRRGPSSPGRPACGRRVRGPGRPRRSARPGRCRRGPPRDRPRGSPPPTRPGRTTAPARRSRDVRAAASRPRSSVVPTTTVPAWSS